MNREEMNREEIITLYEDGGFLAEYAPTGDWHRYLPNYKPLYEPGGSLARMIEPEIPRQMKEVEELEIDYTDNFAKMVIYKLNHPYAVYDRELFAPERAKE